MDDDALRFEGDKLQAELIRDTQEYPGVRVRLTAFLGKARASYVEGSTNNIATFERVVAALDPDGRFRNDFTEYLSGTPGGSANPWGCEEPQ